MLKKFFTVFLGSMAAIWLSILILIGIAIVAVVGLLASGKGTSVKPHSVLYLKLSGEVSDRYEPLSVQDLLMGVTDIPESFDEISEAIRLATYDSNITGIYLDLRGATMGMAMRQELRSALHDFKKSSGKWVLAYADNYEAGDYFTATSADEVYINPAGRLNANGMGVAIPFFKNALDKLGVEIQVIKVGTFKSAVEPFILTQISDSARMQYDVMLSSIWDGYVADVVSGRSLPADSAAMFKRMASAPMSGYTAEQLIGAKLFSGAKYAYEVHNLLKKKAGSGDKLELVTPRTYLGSMHSDITKALNDKTDHIAVVYAIGDIVDTGSEGIVGDKMSSLIAKLADDDHVKGLVLRVNSGGGSAFASEQIWAALEYFKSKGKPFITSMGDVAASGGYYISCGADKIYADPATITGSIGIFGIIPYAKDLLNDKLGINFSVVETNPNAVFPRLDAPLTPDQREALEKSVHDGYDLFVNRVATGRKMKDTDVRRIAEGRIWAGATAKEIGLVDVMGGLYDAVNDMAQKTGLPTDRCKDYPAVNETPLELLLSLQDGSADALSPSSRSSSVMRLLGITATEFGEGAAIVSRIRNMSAVQAKMEDIRVH